MSIFTIPARATTESVNRALSNANLNLSVCEDPYNNHNYTISCDINNGGASTDLAKTRCDTAREVAEYINENAESLERRARYWGSSIYPMHDD